MSISDGDTWFKNNLNSYITWAKSHNSLFILTFDEDDGNHNEHIPTLFVGQMVKGGSYSGKITHYNVLRRIEEIYGLTNCANSASNTSITNVWRNNSTDINQLAIYPNPTSSQFTIKSTGSQSGYTMEVFNVTGEDVYQSVLSTSQNTIDLSSRPEGMYFVYLKSERRVAVGKVLITK